MFILLSLIVRHQPIAAQAQAAKAWYCMPCNNACDTITFAAAGKCPHCGMTLLQQTSNEHKKTMNKKKLKVAFYLQNGVEVLDFAGPMEVIAYAQFEVFTVSKTKAPIVSQGILKILPDYSIEDVPKADISPSSAAMQV